MVSSHPPRGKRTQAQRDRRRLREDGGGAVALSFPISCFGSFQTTSHGTCVKNSMPSGPSPSAGVRASFRVAFTLSRSRSARQRLMAPPSCGCCVISSARYREDRTDAWPCAGVGPSSQVDAVLGAKPLSFWSSAQARSLCRSDLPDARGMCSVSMPRPIRPTVVSVSGDRSSERPERLRRGCGDRPVASPIERVPRGERSMRHEGRDGLTGGGKELTPEPGREGKASVTTASRPPARFRERSCRTLHDVILSPGRPPWQPLVWIDRHCNESS